MSTDPVRSCGATHPNVIGRCGRDRVRQFCDPPHPDDPDPDTRRICDPDNEGDA